MIFLPKKLKAYVLRHLQVLLFSLGQLWRQPFSSLMTLMVIGIALALPAGLYVFLSNINQVSHQWDEAAQISLFLKPDINTGQARQLQQQLQSWPEISNTTYQSPEQSLEEFRQQSGLGTLLDNLPHNPLPALIIVYPVPHATPDEVARLMTKLRKLPDIDVVQLDMEWVQRLHTLIDLAQRILTLLAILLSLSVLLVIGNTIRLAILSRQNEIRVIKLVGGTHRFIRRPFLYTGLWYGGLGGLIAWFILQISFSIIRPAINDLARQYHSDYAFMELSGQLFLLLPLFGIILGMTGAWLAVGRHLNDIEPE